MNEAKIAPMMWDLMWSLAPRGLAPPDPDTNKIAPIIHLIYGLWDDGPLPLRYRPKLGSWLRRHRRPHWNVILWSRQQAEALVDSRYPELAQLYRDFERPVQRADLLRYLLLYEFGGFYADLDILCVRSLSHLLSQFPEAAVIVKVETTLSAERATEIGRTQPIRHGRPEHQQRIANYFMAARSRHPVLAEIIALVKERAHLRTQVDYDVIYTTGPDVVSEVLHRHQHDADVSILPRAHAEEYVRHLFWGSWRRN